MNPKQILSWAVAVVALILLVYFVGRDRPLPPLTSSTIAIPVAEHTGQTEAAKPVESSWTKLTASAAGLESVDLTPFFIKSPFTVYSLWLALPRDFQTMASVPFEYQNYIGLYGKAVEASGRSHRDQVVDIPVGRKFAALYVLHAVSYSTDANEDGEPVAQIILHFKDGTAATNEVVYGTHVLGWWHSKSDVITNLKDPKSVVAWRWSGATLPKSELEMRLFATEFANAKPGVEVATIDLVSSRGIGSELILAITTGPAGVLKDPKIDKVANETR